MTSNLYAHNLETAEEHKLTNILNDPVHRFVKKNEEVM